MKLKLLFLDLKRITFRIINKKFTLIDSILNLITKRTTKLENIFNKTKRKNLFETLIILAYIVTLISILFLPYKYFLPFFINALCHIYKQLLISKNAECGGGMSCLGDRSPQNSPDSGMRSHNEKLKEQKEKYKETYEYDLAAAKNTVAKKTTNFATGAALQTMEDISNRKSPTAVSAIKGGIKAVAFTEMLGNPLDEKIEQTFPRKEGERPNTGEEDND